MGKQKTLVVCTDPQDPNRELYKKDARAKAKARGFDFPIVLMDVTFPERPEEAYQVSPAEATPVKIQKNGPIYQWNADCSKLIYDALHRQAKIANDKANLDRGGDIIELIVYHSNDSVSKTVASFFESADVVPKNAVITHGTLRRSDSHGDSTDLKVVKYHGSCIGSANIDLSPNNTSTRDVGGDSPYRKRLYELAAHLEKQPAIASSVASPPRHSPTYSNDEVAEDEGADDSLTRTILEARFLVEEKKGWPLLTEVKLREHMQTCLSLIDAFESYHHKSPVPKADSDKRALIKGSLNQVVWRVEEYKCCCEDGRHVPIDDPFDSEKFSQYIRQANTRNTKLPSDIIKKMQAVADLPLVKAQQTLDRSSKSLLAMPIVTGGASSVAQALPVPRGVIDSFPPIPKSSSKKSQWGFILGVLLSLAVVGLCVGVILGTYGFGAIPIVIGAKVAFGLGVGFAATSTVSAGIFGGLLWRETRKAEGNELTGGVATRREPVSDSTVAMTQGLAAEPRTPPPRQARRPRALSVDSPHTPVGQRERTKGAAFTDWRQSGNQSPPSSRASGEDFQQLRAASAKMQNLFVRTDGGEEVGEVAASAADGADLVGWSSPTPSQTTSV